MRKKATAAQQYYAYARSKNNSIVLAARAHAMQREYQLLKNTSLKDLMGKKLHVL